jgi:hypothetical protein
LNKDFDYFSAQNLDRVSLIISQITSSFGASPIITPPVFMEKTDEK